jgi:hypothetical protein
MRRIIHGSLVALLVLVALPAAAADAHIGEAPVEKSGPKNTITANPLALAFGTFNLEYERAFRDHLSFYVAPSYLGMELLGVSIEGFGLGGGLRYFVSGTAPQGFFLSPGIELSYVTLGEDNVEASAMGWSATGLVGYTWLLGDVFALSLGGGVSYVNVEAEAGSLTLGYSGIVPSARFAIGGAF